MDSGADPPPDAMGAAKTIVLVEDEVLIRLELADYLRDCGYRVIEANNADEALMALRSGTDVDVVLSDVQMPGSMDGFGLARWIREHRPGMRVILASGVVKSAEAASDLCQDGPMMQKPYQRELIVQRIRALLRE